MKKSILIVALLLCGLIAVPNGIADEMVLEDRMSEETAKALATKMGAMDDENYNEKKMKEKLKRGAINIVTSPLEMPKQIKHYYNEGKAKDQRNVVWIFVGAVKGVANFVGRLGSGLWDVATFNVDKPADFEPLMKPDYVNEKE